MANLCRCSAYSEVLQAAELAAYKRGLAPRQTIGSADPVEEPGSFGSYAGPRMLRFLAGAFSVEGAS
jgi:hypothetical protein